MISGLSSFIIVSEVLSISSRFPSKFMLRGLKDGSIPVYDMPNILVR